MSLDNMTPDEVRLLDEFAKAAISPLCLNESYDITENMIAEHAYDLAADMIAERRKRVPSPLPPLLTVPAEPPDVLLSECDRKALNELRAELPPAEQPADGGLLTDEAIGKWRHEARFLAQGACYVISDADIDEAVNMLREGLRAKQERDEARAALAEAQPVLDAVVHCHSDKTPFMHSIAAGKLLDAYADRRRAQQAKQDGGAK